MWWTELISLLNKAFGIALPLIEESEAKALTKEENERLSKWAEITATVDDNERRNLTGAYVSQLCIDTGNPIGRVSGTSIEVPLEYFESFIKGNVKLIRITKEYDIMLQTIRRASK